MPSSRQKFGSWAESLAEDFLCRKGFVTIDRHLTSRYGELDLLMRDGKIVVAVEVKARRNQKYGRAIEGMTDLKLARLAATIDDILANSYWPEERMRIDVVTVEPSGVEHLVGVGLEG